MTDYLLNSYFSYQFFKKISALLSCKINVLDFFGTGDFFFNFCYIAKYWNSGRIKLLVGNICTSHKYLRGNSHIDGLKNQFSHNFQTKAAPTFTRGSKNLFSFIEFTVEISSQSITSNRVIFSLLKVILGDIDPNKFFKIFFFGRPLTFYAGGKNSEDHG